ncbi:hypothetical protein OROMI_032195 [Orobanche minor]
MESVPPPEEGERPNLNASGTRMILTSSSSNNPIFAAPKSQVMKKTQSTIHGFFKRKHVSSSSQDPKETTNTDNTPSSNVPIIENPSKRVQVDSASSKRTDQLRDAQVEQIAYLISIDELETGRGLNQIGARARNEHSDHTLEHHHRVDIFYEAINCQSMELDHLFSDSSMELLRLASTLDPKHAYETFRSADVCQLVEKFYPEDFSDHEKTIMKMQLLHYDVDVVQHADYRELTPMSELCQWLVRTRREATFDIIYRVISLLLILPVSTATTERSFSAMNIVKTRLRNKMEDDFINDSMVLFIEREIAKKISLEKIVEDFKVAKDRRVPL